MGARLTTSLALSLLVVAAAGERRKRRSVVGLVTNAAAQVVDVNSVVEEVDVEAIVERLDVNAIVDRIDLDQLIARIDPNEILDRIDPNDLLDRIDPDRLLARVDPDALLDRVDANRLLDRVDPDRLLERVDPNLLLDRVDPNRLLDRVDPNRLLDNVDPDRLLDRVDPDRLLDRMDPNRLLDRVDANRLLDRVDTNQLVANTDINAAVDRIDIDRILDRVDVVELVDRAGVPDIIKESTGQVAGSVLDVARRQIVAIDQIMSRVGMRVTRRDPDDAPRGPALLVDAEPGSSKTGRGVVTGHYAGALSRLLAFTADAFIVFGLFTLSTTLLLFLLDRVLGVDIDLSPQQTLAGFFLFLGWAFTYSVVSMVIASRTVGKALVGLRIVGRDGAPLRLRQITVRVLVTPVALVTFLVSYLGLFFGREHRALTDVIAGTAVVYDWGDRTAEMPAPLTRWIQKQDVEDPPPL